VGNSNPKYEKTKTRQSLGSRTWCPEPESNRYDLAVERF
jgi:hypothetical protein